MRLMTAFAVAAMLGAAVVPTASAASSKGLSRSGAERAVEGKVKRVYARRVGGRDVWATCKRISSRYYDCEYSVELSKRDAFDCGYYNDDCDPSAGLYSGTGTVKQARNGVLVVRISYPR